MAKKQFSASITVFLSLIFVLVAALVLTIAESARTISQKLYMQTALNSAMESLFSEFHRPLWENYRIYALEYRDDKLLQEELEGFTSLYTEAKDLFPCKVEKEDFLFPNRGILCEDHYFEEEVLEYMPALLAKDAIEFLGEKKEDTEALATLEDFQKKEKESKSIEELQKKYSLSHRDIEALEGLIETIDMECKACATQHKNGAKALSAHNPGAFYSSCAGFTAGLERIQQTVPRYQSTADSLREKVAQLRQHFEEEKPNLEEDGIAAIEAELSSYDQYLDAEGSIRQNIEALPPKCDSLKAQAETVKQEVKDFEEWLEEEREARRENEDEEDDDEEDLSQEIQDFYHSAEAEWNSFSLPAYNGQVTKINKQNRKALENLRNLGKKKLLEYLLPEGVPCPSDDEKYAVPPGFSTNSKANPLQVGLLGEYSLRYFHSYHKKDDDKSIPYSGANGMEVEYLIHQRKSDYANLSAQVLSLLAFREAMNFIYIMKSPEMREEAKAFVTAFLAVTLNPIVIEVFTLFVIGIWAFAQSLIDVRQLLDDKRVPLMHSEESWRLSLSHLLTFNINEEGGDENQGKHGLSYQDYCRAFLFASGCLSQSKVNDRMLYCMEKNIQSTVSEKESQFQLEHCLYFLSTDAGIKSKHSLYHKGFLESLGLRPEEHYQFTLHSDYKYKNLSH